MATKKAAKKINRAGLPTNAAKALTDSIEVEALKAKVRKLQKELRTKQSQPEVFVTNDLVLQEIWNLKDEVPITVRINAKTVDLQIGPRDLLWDRETKMLTGAGTAVPPTPDETTETTVEETTAATTTEN
jgi:hypothetical protein